MWGDHDDTDEQNALRKVEDNDGSLSHDALVGGAVAVAMKEWQEKKERDGEPQDYETGKTVFAGLAAAALTHLVETKGMDQIDSLKAKHDAAEQAKKALAQSGIYGQQSYQTREYNRDGDDNDNDRSGSRGYGGTNNNNDDSYGNNERSNRAEVYGNNESGAYGSNEYGRGNQGNEYGSRNRDENEYGNENRRGEGRGEGYGGDRSNDY
ncbi:hypothetical protein HD553DRAFT_336615 [Filobasidium floriforme]|uniref:uncharacterized protein n=1 Tax=Filobasidium floriforme TaxID=5210 RepID=UPI001E8CA24E|nr:uncharacterized protein HD553DRAFT_336615 [Filobasidium floriforme]KAH8081218.1 hypothetical protein HD553DRAFT_336615 [Filobasidium floriforme]